MAVVRVIAYPRIHVTLLDMNGALGRVNGGIGFAIDRPTWQLEFSGLGFRSARSRIEGGSHAERLRVAAHLQRLRERCGGRAVKVVIRDSIPAHVGLGSGTSLLMAVTEAYSVLNGLPYDEQTIVAASGRGRTSGIGVTTYFSGGFVFDLGHRLMNSESAAGDNISFAPSSGSANRGAAAVLLSRPMPDWGVVILRSHRRGPSGTMERRFFRHICPIPSREVERLSRIVTMLAVPAVLEADLASFSQAIGLIQASYWKRREISWYGPTLRRLMTKLNGACAAEVGMSSLGPSLYCVTSDIASVSSRAVAVVGKEGGAIIRAKPRNAGREMEIVRRRERT